jgi:hypothetical protein
MSYSIQYVFTSSAIDEAGQRIFAPVIGAINVHTINIFCGALPNIKGFSISHPWIVLDGNIIGHKIEKSDEIYVVADYFYKTSDKNILSFAIGSNYSDKEKTGEILASHYIDGHFALDCGLYKEAVFNFGTVVEALVNTNLEYCRLESGITKDVRFQNEPDLKQKMLFINSLRNRVHPEQISNVGLITREEALKARLVLQDIIFWFYQNVKA